MWPYKSGSVRIRHVPGNSTGAEANGFNSRGITEIDGAIIDLPDTGMDLFARLFSSETMMAV